MTTIVVMIGLALHSFGGGVLTDELAAQIGHVSPDQMVSCIVFMNTTYPYSEMGQYTVHEMIELFRSITQTSQQNVMAWLSSIPNEAVIHNQYWVSNCFSIEATPAVIGELTKRDDVAWISHNGEVHIITQPSDKQTVSSRVVEWNILKIMADSCWNAGFTGQGIILGETDTGVEYTHPAITGKWAGYWFVASGLPQNPTPYDDHDHGTHCMGTILGGDGFGPFTDDIGVAYNATFVAAKVLNASGSGTYDQCLQGLQFMADLKDSVDVKAVSNSWSGSNAADTFFYPVMRTYIAIGIVPVFANGNNGPGSGTVGCPGSYSNNIGVGATDVNDNIADFSSRGPAPNQPPFNDPSTWLRDDWNLIKPQISAPGVSVRSCVPGGGYATWNGTSMATPHVAGAIGIICQKNPNLTPEMIYSILLDNVDEPSQGAPYPNNIYGWGRLNVWKALNGTPTMDQPWIAVLRKTMDDIGPGQTGLLSVTVKNVGGDDAYNTTGILESFDNFISVNNETYVFGNLAPNDTANNSASPYQFTAHSLTPPGHKAKIGLILHADGDHDTLDFDDTLYYSFTVGTPPPPVTIFEDDFEYGGGIDSFPHYWEISGNWQRTTAQFHSPTHSAYSGVTLDNVTYLTLKNAVDLSSFSDPQLGFWHRYDFDSGIFMDDASVQVSTNGGSTWTTIWEYNWLDGNTLPWTEMTVSVPSSNNVKVRYAIDGYTFFQEFTDWYIDDFIFFTPADNEPPYFTNTTIWPDTNFTGPFPVQSIISDVSGVDQAVLIYRVNGSSWQNVGMTHQGNDVYQGIIPQQNLDDTIDYYLWARDLWITPNEGTDPIGAPGDGYYSFQTSIIGVDEEIVRNINFAMLGANPTRNNVTFNLTIPRDVDVTLVIYDALGRVVRTLVRETVKAGDYAITWDRRDDVSRNIAAGIYFVSLSLDDISEYRRVQKLIVLK